MKFLITWRMRPATVTRAVERFLNTGDPLPAGVKSLGRWHRADLQGGAHLVETMDSAALAQYSAQWSDLIDLDTTMVVEDAEAITAYQRMEGVRPQTKSAGGK